MVWYSTVPEEDVSCKRGIRTPVTRTVRTNLEDLVDFIPKHHAVNTATTMRESQIKRTWVRGEVISSWARTKLDLVARRSCTFPNQTLPGFPGY